MKGGARHTAEMVGAMLISGTIGWFVVKSGLPAVEVVFWRCLFGAASLLAVCAWMGLLRMTWLQAGIAALGGVAIALTWLLLFAAFSRASIAIATSVFNVQPFMLALAGAWLLGERITAAKLAWLGVAFAGMLLIVLGRPAGEGSSYLAGIVCALGSALAYTAAMLITKRLKGVKPQLVSLVQLTAGALVLLPLALVSPLPSGVWVWADLVSIGAINTGLMYLLLTSAVQALPSATIGALSFLYPVAAILVDYLGFGHVLGVPQMAGAAAILLAAAGTTLGWGGRR